MNANKGDAERSGEEAPIEASKDKSASESSSKSSSKGPLENSAARGEDRRLARALARSAARLAAVQALFQMELTGAGVEEVGREFENHRLGAEIEGAQYREADLGHFRELLQGVVARQSEIDGLTDAALVERWPLGKIDPTLRATFRCGGFELLGMPKVPPRVAISEYVDVAKAFFPDGQEPRFVNAVLDHMARRARPEAFDAKAPPQGDA